jgi:hypothetical protein
LAVDTARLDCDYGPMVLRRCRRLLGDEEAARDTMQDTFVAVLRSADRLNDAAPSSLLWRVATNVCLHRLRSARRRPEVLDAELLVQIALTDDTEARSATLERRRHLVDARGRHTAGDRAAAPPSWLRWAAPLVIADLALAVVRVLPSASDGAAADAVAPAATLGDAPLELGERSEGAVHRGPLLVFRKEGDAVSRLQDSAKVSPGDLLQIGVAPEAAGFVTIFSLDGRGAVTRHLPERPATARWRHRAGGRLTSPPRPRWR